MMSAPTDVPTLTPQKVNRQVRLIARPDGIPQAHHFALVEEPIPTPQEGEFLVRNIYLSVDPAQRGWASAEANYSQPVPLDTPMRALAVGVVVATRCPDVSEGEYLYGWFGWQDYSVCTPAEIMLRARQAVPLAQVGGLTGINGLTAYLALTRIGRPETGDTLVVSTAAGGVGSLVGQIGRLLGCRTIGLTGSDEKVALCQSEYGYDVALNYRTADLATELPAVAPDGINVYYDNVGGPILDTCLRQMAIAGRVVQCGTAAIASWNPPPTGLRNEREVLTRRLVWGGFILFDHLDGYDKAVAQLASWYAAGDIDLRLEVREGIEHAAGSIADLYAGRNLGKRLIRLV